MNFKQTMLCVFPGHSKLEGAKYRRLLEEGSLTAEVTA